jgi:penicillin-binding protein 1C
MEIFNELSRHKDSWFTKPDGVGMRKICPVSGDALGPFCKNSTEDLYIKSATGNLTCAVHKQIYINKKTGLRADAGHLKLPETSYTKKIIEDWPPEAAAFLRQTGGLLENIPPYGKDEAPDGSYLKPKITSPVEGNLYTVNAAMPVKFQMIPLKVAAAGGAESKIFWFANGKVVASGSADKTYYLKPEPGTYKVEVQDALGMSDSVKFKVYEQ